MPQCHFVQSKGKRQNQLTDEHIAEILKTYQLRKTQERYSRRVSMAEIEKNDFNLNISRYVSTAEQETEIDLAATHRQLVEIEERIRTSTRDHNRFLEELGLPLLPPGDRED
jgi:type I restriction enzyme M protein